jgi:hypothetical protein
MAADLATSRANLQAVQYRLNLKLSQRRYTEAEYFSSPTLAFFTLEGAHLQAIHDVRELTTYMECVQVPTQEYLATNHPDRRLGTYDHNDLEMRNAMEWTALCPRESEVVERLPAVDRLAWARMFEHRREIFGASTDAASLVAVQRMQRFRDDANAELNPLLEAVANMKKRLYQKHVREYVLAHMISDLADIVGLYLGGDMPWPDD